MRTAIVSVILFLSGSSALLFQTLWLRLSGLAFGNSVWAAALILSSFMAGLALGSAIAASWTLQRWRPLRVYAGLEVVVAVFGCTLLTLPVLLEDPLLTHQEFGRTIGTLYGFNTLGAVAGALLGETYLVRTCGLLGTGLTAGCVSCAAAGIAWLFSGAETVGQTPKRFRLLLWLGNRPPWRLLFVSMGAGAILLGLEVIWFRFIRL